MAHHATTRAKLHMVVASGGNHQRAGGAQKGYHLHERAIERLAGLRRLWIVAIDRALYKAIATDIAAERHAFHASADLAGIHHALQDPAKAPSATGAQHA